MPPDAGRRSAVAVLPPPPPLPLSSPSPRRLVNDNYNHNISVNVNRNELDFPWTRPRSPFSSSQFRRSSSSNNCGNPQPRRSRFDIRHDNMLSNLKRRRPPTTSMSFMTTEQQQQQQEQQHQRAKREEQRPKEQSYENGTLNSNNKRSSGHRNNHLSQQQESQRQQQQRWNAGATKGTSSISSSSQSNDSHYQQQRQQQRQVERQASSSRFVLHPKLQGRFQLPHNNNTSSSSNVQRDRSKNEGYTTTFTVTSSTTDHSASKHNNNSNYNQKRQLQPKEDKWTRNSNTAAPPPPPPTSTKIQSYVVPKVQEEEEEGEISTISTVAGENSKTKMNNNDDSLASSSSVPRKKFNSSNNKNNNSGDDDDGARWGTAKGTATSTSNSSGNTVITIGTRVEIYWDGEDQFFAGTLTKQHPKSWNRGDCFFIEYDDGDKEWIHLDREIYRLCSDSNNNNKNDFTNQNETKNNNTQKTTREHVVKKKKQKKNVAAVTQQASSTGDSQVVDDDVQTRDKNTSDATAAATNSNDKKKNREQLERRGRKASLSDSMFCSPSPSGEDTSFTRDMPSTEPRETSMTAKQQLVLRESGTESALKEDDHELETELHKNTTTSGDSTKLSREERKQLKRLLKRQRRRQQERLATTNDEIGRHRESEKDASSSTSKHPSFSFDNNKTETSSSICDINLNKPSPEKKKRKGLVNEDKPKKNPTERCKMSSLPLPQTPLSSSENTFPTRDESSHALSPPACGDSTKLTTSAIATAQSEPSATSFASPPSSSSKPLKKAILAKSKTCSSSPPPSKSSGSSVAEVELCSMPNDHDGIGGGTSSAGSSFATWTVTSSRTSNIEQESAPEWREMKVPKKPKKWQMQNASKITVLLTPADANTAIASSSCSALLQTEGVKSDTQQEIVQQEELPQTAVEAKKEKRAVTKNMPRGLVVASHKKEEENWVLAGLPTRSDSSESETDEEELMDWAAKMFGIHQHNLQPPIARRKVTSERKVNEGVVRSPPMIHIRTCDLHEEVHMPISEAVKLGRRRHSSSSSNTAEIPVANKRVHKEIAVDGQEEVSKRRKEEARPLSQNEINAILARDLCPAAASAHWVRRSMRQPSRSALDSPPMKALLQKLRSNDTDMIVLKMKKYVNDPDAPQIVLDAVLDALEENTNCESLYIQNFNEGMRDPQVLRLLEILKKPTCKIWCLNIGETYKVKHKTWKKFANGLADTKITHMYASEHTITPELKEQIRSTIRDNRKKHNMHCDPENLDTIIQCTHCWWNPINTKSLRPYLKKQGVEHILNDKDLQGLRGATGGAGLL